MSRSREILERLEAGMPFDEVARQLSVELDRVEASGDFQELLGASSMLLHAAARDGHWQAVDHGRGLAALESVRGPEAATAVLAVGQMGANLLSSWSGDAMPPVGCRSILLDCDSAMLRTLPGDVPRVILDSRESGDGPIPTSQGEVLRGAYRIAASAGGPPPALADWLLAPRAQRMTLHLVIGLDDPWLAVAADLAIDLRALLGHAVARLVLHLVARPAPRLRGALVRALEELQQSRPVDDVFLVSGTEAQAVARVSEMIRLTDAAPEILAASAGADGGRPRSRGTFASYGLATLRWQAAMPAGERLQTADDAMVAAAPSWLPGCRPLPEMVDERAFLVYEAEEPVPDEIWRICPDAVLVPISGAQPTICRLQRGLTLPDLRLGRGAG